MSIIETNAFFFKARNSSSTLFIVTLSVSVYFIKFLQLNTHSVYEYYYLQLNKLQQY